MRTLILMAAALWLAILAIVLLNANKVRADVVTFNIAVNGEAPIGANIVAIPEPPGVPQIVTDGWTLPPDTGGKIILEIKVAIPECACQEPPDTIETFPYNSPVSAAIYTLKAAAGLAVQPWPGSAIYFEEATILPPPPTTPNK